MSTRLGVLIEQKIAVLFTFVQVAMDKISSQIRSTAQAPGISRRARVL